ncbi:MAG: glycosyltransferase [Negativicutes bacterium]|nr:glycosyltransferase [Negativicutes bacterium]
MKILFVHCLGDKSKGGGAEVSLWTLMRALSLRGHECILVVTADGKGKNRDTVDGIKVWSVGIRNIFWPFSKSKFSRLRQVLWHIIDSYNPLMGRALDQIISIENPDIISCHNLPGWSCSVWNSAKRAKRPCIQVLHDYYNLCVISTKYKNNLNCVKRCMKCKILRISQKILGNKIDAVVGISGYILNDHLKFELFQNTPIKCVIYNRRDSKSLNCKNIAQLNSRDGINIGFMGSLVPSKGVELIINSARMLNFSNLHFLIAGEGDSKYVNQLKNKSTDNISFLGRTSPANFFPNIDVLVVPSLWNEPLGMVIAESFMFGKPVIGSNRGGIPEMISHEYNGLIFQVEKKNDLTRCIEKFCTSNKLRVDLSVGAKKSGFFFASTEDWAKEYEDLYFRIVK